MTTGAPAGGTERVRGCPHGHPPVPVPPWGSGSHLLCAGRRPPAAGAASRRRGAGAGSRLGPWVSARAVCVCGWKAGGERGLSGLCGFLSRVNPFILIRRELASGPGKFPVRKEGGHARLTRNQRTQSVILVPKSPRDGESPPPRWAPAQDGRGVQANSWSRAGRGKALRTLGRDPPQDWGDGLRGRLGFLYSSDGRKLKRKKAGRFCLGYLSSASIYFCLSILNFSIFIHENWDQCQS